MRIYPSILGEWCTSKTKEIPQQKWGCLPIIIGISWDGIQYTQHWGMYWSVWKWWGLHFRDKLVDKNDAVNIFDSGGTLWTKPCHKLPHGDDSTLLCRTAASSTRLSDPRLFYSVCSTQKFPGGAASIYLGSLGHSAGSCPDGFTLRGMQRRQVSLGQCWRGVQRTACQHHRALLGLSAAGCTWKCRPTSL